MITFEHVSKVYPDGTHAVHDLTFDAPSGRLTVLVGPSGCGKTTSMRMINRLIDPTEGVVSLDGQDTRSVDPIDLRRKIGYVIQSAGLFPHRTVVDNVAALPRLLGAGKKEARTSALELLAKVGLDERYARRYPYQLSGGQQQRVGVARALATDPPFLLMDEPFSAVDPVVRTQLQDSFLQLQRDIGKTIVMVTHDIDEALKLGDQVAVFREGGTLAQVATPVELLAHPADAFVADFVGASRGYRALGFVEATATVGLADEVTVQVGARPADVGGVVGVDGGWCVVVDDADAPLGWVDLRAAGDVVEGCHIDFSGTVARADGSLRDLLDAALSSPTGRGLVAGPDGRLQGSVTADEVLRHIGRGREAEVAS